MIRFEAQIHRDGGRVNGGFLLPVRIKSERIGGLILRELENQRFARPPSLPSPALTLGGNHV